MDEFQKDLIAAPNYTRFATFTFHQLHKNNCEYQFALQLCTLIRYKIWWTSSYSVDARCCWTFLESLSVRARKIIRSASPILPTCIQSSDRRDHTYGGLSSRQTDVDRIEEELLCVALLFAGVEWKRIYWEPSKCKWTSKYTPGRK